MRFSAIWRMRVWSLGSRDRRVYERHTELDRSPHRRRRAAVGSRPAGQARQGHASRPPATRKCRRSSSAAWRCCTPTGSPKRARPSTAVLQQDPSCAMAYWGLAVNYLGNSLAAAPSPKDATWRRRRRWRRRARSARKTQRERDWIEAISAYYRDHDKVPVDTRLAAYTKAMEQMTQRYPDDFEAWVFYALTLQASAPKTDKTYANQLKSAAILERLFKQNPQHPGRGALPDPRLRLSAARRQGHRDRAALRRHRAGRAARPAHALAHLLDGRDVGGVDRVEPLGARDPARLLPRHRLHGVRASAARAGRQGQGAGRDDRRRCRARTYPNLADFTALAAMPARYALERGDWAGAAALPVVRPRPATGRLADPLRARSRHGAQRRSGRRQARDPGDAGAARRAGEIRISPTGPIAPKSRCWPSPPGSRWPKATRRRRR